MSIDREENGIRVVVVGAGFCGLIAGIALKRAGIDDFVIYDREAELGGTWFVNRFPGVAVDTMSEIYRLSYLPYNWSRSHASGREVLDYMQYAAREFRVADHVKCGSVVTSIAWDDRRSLYRIRLADGREDHANAVISAVGLLSEPFYPPWPGLDSFKGQIFHTSRWDEAIDYSGKRVAVIGTGSTAAQVVPEMAKTAGELLVFQKLAGWILPKPETDFARDPGPVRNDAEAAARERERRQALAEAAALFADGRLSQKGSAENLAAQAYAEKHLKDSLADRPDLIPLVTPNHPFLGTRPVQSNDFYPALKRDNVKLVPREVVRATESGLVDSDGVEHPVDIVVLATGFRAAEFLSSLDVVGRDGVNLRDFWQDEPRAFLGVAVPHFPNFFIMYGPNTNATGALLPMFEGQAEFAVDTIQELARSNTKALQVSEEAFTAFNDWLDGHFANSAFRTAENYFTSKTGRVVTNWPRSVELYLKMLREERPKAMVEVNEPCSRPDRATQDTTA